MLLPGMLHVLQVCETHFSGVAAIAILASAASLYSVRAVAPFQSQSDADGLSLNHDAITLPSFTELVQRVKPAVVSVRVKADGAGEEASETGSRNPFEGTPSRSSSRASPARKDKPHRGRHQTQHHYVQGQGSGFLISTDGYIVTNNHVVSKAVKVEVATDDGGTFEAKVIGADPQTDLALIEVEGRTDFPFVKLAKEPPKIGEWIMAMGNPFGLGGTVTAGIVSAQGRDIGSGPYDDYIQIDAPVNRGNSGGPTFNLKGEVIGVNTAIYSPSGGSVGIAFDIPASTVESVIPQLQKRGSVERGWLGVEVQAVTKEVADGLGIKEAAGALVSTPQPGSPAAKAGIR